MSRIPLEPVSTMSISDEPLANLLFEYPGADVILRTRDHHHFRVPKSYILNSSPILDELIRKALRPLDDENCEISLPVVELPESGAIIHSLLTFVFPVPPLIPSTTEETMELLSVAQKYQMVSVLAHIRGIILQQNPPTTQRDAALHVYSLAQKYGLRREALQAARTILKYPMSIEDLEDMLDIMPGASFYELWKYYEEVRAILSSDLAEFRVTGARGTLAGLHCDEFSPSRIPGWLDDYIGSIGDAPNVFDHIEFNTALVRHLHPWKRRKNSMCTCGSTSGQTIRNFWEALSSTVEGSFKKAESALCLVQEREDIQSQLNRITSLPEILEVPDPNLIIQSSDLVNFRVHKQVLAMSSPFFRDLLSLPQSSDSESIDGLPMVKVPEDAKLLNSLVSMLYPVRPAVPDSYEQVLYLLAACQKYDMDQVQSSIRTEVQRGGFPSPIGAEVFGAYGIASDKGLIPEMEDAAHLTLEHPMTFEMMGKCLRLFHGSALRDLVRFRKACRDNLVSCLRSFLEVEAPGPSSIWVGCHYSPRSIGTPSPAIRSAPLTTGTPPTTGIPPPTTGIPLPTTGTPPTTNIPAQTTGIPPPPIDTPSLPGGSPLSIGGRHVLPTWLYDVLSPPKESSMQVLTHPLATPSRIRARYLTAIQKHNDCNFCLRVYLQKGSSFGAELESRLKEARDKVRRDS